MRKQSHLIKRKMKKRVDNNITKISEESFRSFEVIMASIPSCTAPSSASFFFSTTKPINASSSSLKLSSRFLGTRVVKLRLQLGPSNGSRTTCWFKFGKNGVDAENAGIYGSQSRDDFDRDDVEQVCLYLYVLESQFKRNYLNIWFWKL